VDQKERKRLTGCGKQLGWRPAQAGRRPWIAFNAKTNTIIRHRNTTTSDTAQTAASDKHFEVACQALIGRLLLLFATWP
jgi:hypothetical protein